MFHGACLGHDRAHLQCFDFLPKPWVLLWNSSQSCWYMPVFQWIRPRWTCFWLWLLFAVIFSACTRRTREEFYCRYSFHLICLLYLHDLWARFTRCLAIQNMERFVAPPVRRHCTNGSDTGAGPVCQPTRYVSAVSRFSTVLHAGHETI